MADSLVSLHQFVASVQRAEVEVEGPEDVTDQPFQDDRSEQRQPDAEGEQVPLGPSPD